MELICFIWNLSVSFGTYLFHLRRSNDIRYIVTILSVVEKFPVSKFHILENILYSSMASFTLMFLVNDILVWRDKTVSRALELCARDARSFYVFRSF